MEYENKYLTLKDLEHIKDHKYVTTGYSKLDNLMNPFWIWCVNFVPRVKKIIKSRKFLQTGSHYSV